LQWWEKELRRPYVMSRARSLLELSPSLKALPSIAAPVLAGYAIPSYLKPRMRVLAPPTLTIRGKSRSWMKHMSERAVKAEEEMDATLKYVMHDLAPELYIELMAGFPSNAKARPSSGSDSDSDSDGSGSGRYYVRRHDDDDEEAGGFSSTDESETGSDIDMAISDGEGDD
jgi:hypothetical protein